eukprot:4747717-Pleurochrysis_carterae.AAC.1
MQPARTRDNARAGRARAKTIWRMHSQRARTPSRLSRQNGVRAHVRVRVHMRARLACDAPARRSQKTAPSRPRGACCVRSRFSRMRVARKREVVCRRLRARAQ